MLYTVLHHPIIYDKKQFERDENTYYYTNIIRILRDVLDQCVLLTDKDRRIVTLMVQYINEWPAPFKKNAIEVMKQISKRNRIVEIKDTQATDEIACSIEECDGIHSYFHYDADLSIVLEECLDYIRNENTEVVTLNNYYDSKFLTKKKKGSYIISDKDRTPEKLYEGIFKRIFQYAKLIKIIDRVLGGHIVKHPGMINNNFKTGLDYLAKCIVYACKGRCPIVEIYTTLSINSNLNKLSEDEKKDLNSTIENVEDFINELNEKYGINMKCIFKYDLRHDRFIITDQVGIQIGRGTDVIDNSWYVRDNTISIVEAISTIETSVRSSKTLTDYLR